MDTDKIQLIRQAGRGKQTAFEALFLQEKEYLYRVAFLYMKNREDALDLVQECILKCMQSIHSLKQPEFFRTWMTRILINCAKKEWKARGRYTDDFETESLSMETEELSAEEKLDLYDAIDHLDFPYKAIIIQKYFVGAKLEEIALMLDMPVNTVKVYHLRAKEQLRKMLKEDK